MNKKLYLKVGAIITTVAMVFCAIFGNQINAVETGTEPGVEVSEQAPEAETNPEANPDANQEAVDLTGQDVGHAVIDLNADKASPQQEISSWKWVDPDQVLTDSKLIIPNASADQLLTREVLDTMLPKAILAMVNGTEVEVPLVWDYINYPTNGAYEGVYIINALHKDYVLAKDVPQVSVTVQFESNQISTMAVDDPKYQVPGISPFGTTINLFDYWVTSGGPNAEVADDAGNPTYGINKVAGSRNSPRLLRFLATTNRTDVVEKLDYYNIWTGNQRYSYLKNGYLPLQKMVYNRLDASGFPKLMKDTGAYHTQIPRDESLKYLFDSSNFEGKKSYMDVKNLLQQDNDGYYYYDCNKNFAEFNSNNNSFKLYNCKDSRGNSIGAVQLGGQGDASKVKGQFFPFDAGKEVFNESNGKLVPKSVVSTTPSLNHFFGMTMSTRFVQLEHGKMGGDPNGKDIIYEFTGDDDVWVFIDGVLVGDLGGMHNAVKLTINFSSGEVKIFNLSNNVAKTTTLRKLFADARDTTAFDGNTFYANTVHKLDFFYLERGHTDSNLSLKFNLATIPQSEVVKSDQQALSIPGAEFTLYKTDNTYAVNDRNIIAKGVTDGEGKFIILDDNKKIITLQDLYTKQEYYYNGQPLRHLVLRETKVPLGYRKPKEDIHLKLVARDDGAQNTGVVMQSENVIQTGAYASAKVLTTSGNKITLADNSVVDLNNKRGTMFAVVMQYVGKSDGSEINDVTKWVPVTGNALTGWHVSSGHSFSDIIAAAKKNAYVFTKTQTGTYETEISDLPGNILNYYYMIKNPLQNVDQIKYTIGYFYVPGTLDNADSSKVQRVMNKEFKRQFSTKLFVPNILNMFMVQKVDEFGNPMENSGAKFSLYSDEECLNLVDEMVVTNYSKPSDKIIAKAVAHFPSSDSAPKLGPGVYYVKETTAPNGYEAYPNPIKVIVTDEGIYADAGIKDDDIRVKIGIGSVVRSLLQFTNGDVNGTYADVKASLLNGTISNNKFVPIQNSKPHMMYSKFTSQLVPNSAGQFEASLEYSKLFDDIDCTNKDVHDDDFMINDVGFADLSIEQWYGDQSIPQPNTLDAKKEKVNGDISHLFSKTVMIEVKNKKIVPDDCYLHIKKVVEPADAVDSNASFHFDIKFEHPDKGSYEEHVSWLTQKVTIKNKQRDAIQESLDSQSIKIQKGGTILTPSFNKVSEGNIVIQESDFLKDKITKYNGFSYSWSFDLKHNEELVIKGLPEGTNYTITETNVGSEYQTTIKELNNGFVSNDIVQTVNDTSINGQLLKNASDLRKEDYVLVTNKLSEIKFNFEFMKVNSSSQPLPNAQFDLYELTCKETGTGHEHNQLIDVNNPGQCWKKVNSGAITSDQNGKVVLSNVVAGKTYRLVETRAPGGYVLPDGQWKLVFDNNKVPTITEVGKAPAFENANGYKLHNHKPHELPLTGGRNHKLYAALGLAVMLLGMILTIKAYQRKNNSYDM